MPNLSLRIAAAALRERSPRAAALARYSRSGSLGNRLRD